VRGRSSTDLRRLRGRAGRLSHFLIVAAFLGAAPGCRPDPPDVRTAKTTLAEFVHELRAHDDAALRARTTCLIPTEAIRDARVRSLEPPRSVAVGSLDSLDARYAHAHRAADSLYALTPDTDPAVEERFQVVREWGRRAATVRAARRAATRSAESGDGPTRTAPQTPLVSIRAHVVVHYAGPAVGPDRIERDVEVRLLRAPAGRWVVYAFDLASDPPGPLPF
jgi:hypothetical protein